MLFQFLANVKNVSIPGKENEEEEVTQMETTSSESNETKEPDKKEEREKKTDVDSPPDEVFQTIVNMFPEKSWTIDDIKNRSDIIHT